MNAIGTAAEPAATLIRVEYCEGVQAGAMEMEIAPEWELLIVVFSCLSTVTALAA